MAVPVVVQCKANATKPKPEMIRELEGAVAGAPEGWHSEDTIGVLCAKREATVGVREAVRRSGRGVVWVMVEEVVESNRVLGEGCEGPKGRIKQVFWNERVARMVGEEVGSGVRYVPGVRRMEKEVCLMWHGRVWMPDLKRQDVEDRGLVGE